MGCMGCWYGLHGLLVWVAWAAGMGCMGWYGHAVWAASAPVGHYREVESGWHGLDGAGTAGEGKAANAGG
jgi:hypothetical protein